MANAKQENDIVQTARPIAFHKCGPNQQSRRNLNFTLEIIAQIEQIRPRLCLSQIEIHNLIPTILQSLDCLPVHNALVAVDVALSDEFFIAFTKVITMLP